MKTGSLLLSIGVVLIVPVVGQGEELGVGEVVEEFSLPDYLGAHHSLSEWADTKAIVVAFLGTECPLAKLYGARLAELAKQYESKGVQFVGINSNQQDTLREIAHYARVHKIDFPVLKDNAHVVADQFQATRTPVVFLLDNTRRVRYSGRIDDQYGVGYSRSEASQRFLASALDELLSGKPVTIPKTAAIGCYIGRRRPSTPSGDITYSKHIARVLQDNCVRCHRDGQIAPFALTSYDEAVAWAETAQEVIDDGRMPPWHADPHYGEFANDAAMPSADRELFRSWIKNGMPEGDPSDLPKPVAYTEGWQIGKPDVVYRMPYSFTVPPKGTVPYQYFEIDSNFADDTWVRGAEIRPGNRAVVHHVIVYFLLPGEEVGSRAEDPLFNAIASFAPGMPAGLFPDGYARLVPAHSKLVFQVHYTPNGSGQTDQSEVGLVFADTDEEFKEVKFAVAVNNEFRIPPGADDYHVPAGYNFTQDTLLHSLMPHMHYRGKSFRFTANYPDGKSEILLDVPRYDFNWQNVYTLKSPKVMPKGTVVHCDGRFDNSDANPMNPDPTKEVTWGDQSCDEMMLGTLVTSLPESVTRSDFPKVTRADGEDFDVTFRFRPEPPDAAIQSVYLAGSFNGWKETGHRMAGPDEAGYFLTTVRLKPGTYEYKFVIEGNQWTHDPGNLDLNGPFNNSVVRVRAKRTDK